MKFSPDYIWLKQISSKLSLKTLHKVGETRVEYFRIYLRVFQCRVLEFIQHVSYCYYTSWALAVTQEREILMSSRQEYQSEQGGRQAGQAGQEGRGDKDNTTHGSSSPPLPHTNRNTKSQSFQGFLHDIVIGVIENGIFRGDVSPHVVGKR